MAKEILLYKPMYSETAIDFISQLNANADNDITVRLNCPGGDVYAGYGMIAKFKEHTKGKSVKVDGQAKSGGFYFCVLADNVECLSLTDFMVHRAAAPYWVENSKELFTDEVKAQLNKVNAELRECLESKIDNAKFKAVTGYTYEQLFSLDTRLDVNINAQQAKALGIVQKVNAITAETKNEIMALAAQNGIAAFATEPVIEAITTTSQNITDMAAMTAAEFNAANPTAYAEIVAIGVKNEKTRINAWMKFSAIDAEAVARGIADGAMVDMEVIADMSVKALAGSTVEAVKNDNPKKVTTTGANAAEETAEEVAAKANNSEFLANCAKDLNIGALAPKPAATN